MHPVIRAQLNQFTEINPSTGFNDSDYFEVYSIFSVLNGRLSANIDPFRAHLRGCEFGIDGACILVRGMLATDADEASALVSDDTETNIDFVFIQSKSGGRFDYGDISRFFDAVYGFFEGHMNDESVQLSDLGSAKDIIYSQPLRRNPNIYCYFVTTGNYQANQYLNTLIQTEYGRLSELNLFDIISINMLGAGELQKAYRSATSANASEIDFPKSQTLPNHPDVKEAYIGYVRADQLMQLATSSSDDGSVRVDPSVFYDNVRDFNPDSRINKQIIAEIHNGDRPGFVFRNNGVTVIAKTLNRTRDKFRIENYQIVNGCQTCNILFECRDMIDEIYVPFRLIVSQDDAFITSIILGTNNQNPVKDEQFWALKPFMKDLEEYSRNQIHDKKLFIERRENQYREEAVERTRIVKPTELLKVIVAMYLFEPHRAARDFRRIMVEYNDLIFLEDHDVEPCHLAAYANYKFDFLIRNRRVDREFNIFKYYVFCAMGLQYCRTRSIFCVNRNEKRHICDRIASLVSNEEEFRNYCAGVFVVTKNLIERKYSKGVPPTREQLRDTLRLDGFNKEFQNQLSASNVHRA